MDSCVNCKFKENDDCLIDIDNWAGCSVLRESIDSKHQQIINKLYDIIDENINRDDYDITIDIKKISVADK